LYGLFSSPIVSLLDSGAVQIAQENNSSYGGMRLWGSIGWFISTWLVGVLIETLNIHWLFYCYIVLMMLTFLVALFQRTRKLTVRVSLGKGLIHLFRFEFNMFLISIFLIAIGFGGVNTFFSLYMDQIGAGEGVIGFAWAISALCELPVLFFSKRILQRIGSRRMLIIAFSSYILLWFLFSINKIPLLALMIQAVRGFAFAAYLVGAVTYVSEHAPAGMSTSAQAVFNTIASGLAVVTGSLLGGYLFDSIRISGLFQVFAFLTAAGLAIFLIAGKNKRMTVGVPQ